MLDLLIVVLMWIDCIKTTISAFGLATVFCEAEVFIKLYDTLNRVRFADK